MNSEELNLKIREMCDKGKELEFDVFGKKSGKAIPYIGWFWRDVDFTAETLSFGLIPTPEAEQDELISGDGQVNVELYKVGFMQNNKWGYAEIEATKEETLLIKSLLIEAVINPTPETLSTANEAIQAIRLNWNLSKETRTIHNITFGEYDAERKNDRRKKQTAEF